MLNYLSLILRHCLGQIRPPPQNQSRDQNQGTATDNEDDYLAARPFFLLKDWEVVG